ncbi:cytochrome P450 85A, partial [Cajanus cajan]
MRNILGTNIAEVHGATHKRIRGSLLSLIGPTSVKDRLVPEVDEFMRSYLDNWDGKIIDLQEKTVEMSFFISLKAVVENEPNSFLESFKATFDKMAIATISLPIKFPGTNYYRGLKAREKAIPMLKELLAKRRASSATHGDILDQLMRTENGGHKLDDDEIIEQIITILYSGYET